MELNSRIKAIVFSLSIPSVKKEQIFIAKVIRVGHQTNPIGFYRFNGNVAGQTYVFCVAPKRQFGNNERQALGIYQETSYLNIIVFEQYKDTNFHSWYLCVYIREPWTIKTDC